MPTSLAGRFVLLCWAVFLLYWFVAAFSVKRTVEKHGERWRALTLLLVLSMVALVAGGGPLAPYTRVVLWPQTPVIGLVADALALSGVVVLLWARATLGGNWSGSIVLKEEHELVERGPYRYVRHPIYSGLLLLLLGTAVLQGRVGGFLVFLLFLCGFAFKAREEERLLTRHFPEAYPRYRARVSGLVPFVW